MGQLLWRPTGIKMLSGYIFTAAIILLFSVSSSFAMVSDNEDLQESKEPITIKESPLKLEEKGEVNSRELSKLPEVPLSSFIELTPKDSEKLSSTKPSTLTQSSPPSKFSKTLPMTVKRRMSNPPGKEVKSTPSSPVISSKNALSTSPSKFEEPQVIEIPKSKRRVSDTPSLLIISSAPELNEQRKGSFMKTRTFSSEDLKKFQLKSTSSSSQEESPPRDASPLRQHNEELVTQEKTLGRDGATPPLRERKEPKEDSSEAKK